MSFIKPNGRVELIMLRNNFEEIINFLSQIISSIPFILIGLAWTGVWLGAGFGLFVSLQLQFDYQTVEAKIIKRYIATGYKDSKNPTVVYIFEALNPTTGKIQTYQADSWVTNEIYQSNATTVQVRYARHNPDNSVAEVRFHVMDIGVLSCLFFLCGPLLLSRLVFRWRQYQRGESPGGSGL
jgi:hypothetical protein